LPGNYWGEGRARPLLRVLRRVRERESNTELIGVVDDSLIGFRFQRAQVGACAAVRCDGGARAVVWLCVWSGARGGRGKEKKKGAAIDPLSRAQPIARPQLDAALTHKQHDADPTHSSISRSFGHSTPHARPELPFPSLLPYQPPLPTSAPLCAPANPIGRAPRIHKRTTTRTTPLC